MGVWDKVKDRSKPVSNEAKQEVVERTPARPSADAAPTLVPVAEEVDDDDHDTVIAPSPFGFDSQLPASRATPVRAQPQAPARTPEPVGEDVSEEEVIEAAVYDVPAEEDASADDGDVPDWLRITRETDWANISKEERWERTREIAQGMDWHAYDWKKSPAADFKFPDFTEAEMAKKAPWLPKHYNKVGNM